MADMKYDIDISDVVRARKELRSWAKTNKDSIDIVNQRLRNFGNTSELAFNQFGRAATQAQQKSKRFASVGLQQVGYQVGDFAVQIQGGTNAAVAFGQQFSQLAGIFGAGGAIAGAGVAIATAFIAPLIDAKKEAEDTAKTLGELGKAVSTLSGTYNDLASEIENASGKSKEFLEQQQQVTSLGITAKINEFRKLFSGVSAGAGRVGGASQVLFGVAVKEITEALGISPKYARELVEEIQALNQADGLPATAEAATALREEMFNVLKQNGEWNEKIEAAWGLIIAVEKALGTVSSTYVDILGSAEGLALAEAANLDMFGQLVDESEKFLSAVENAKGDWDKLADIDVSSGVNKAAIEASDLSEHMKQALIAALGLVNLAKGVSSPSKVYSGRGSGKAYGFTEDGLRTTTLSEDYAYKQWLADQRKLGGGGGGGGGASAVDPMERLQQEIDRREKLLKLTESQKTLQEEIWRISDALGENRNKYSDEYIQQLAQQNIALEQQEELQKQIEQTADTIAGHFGDAFTSIVDGTKSVKDAFADMARNILKHLWDILVMQQITGVLGNFFGTTGAISASANGNVFSGGNIVPFANGGIVNGPTLFPMTGSNTGLMGEAGPEAIMPLKRGKDGKLGVSVEGSGSVVVKQEFNFAANGDESVKRIIAQAAPSIAKATQELVLDSRRRGGPMRSTFGR